MLIAWLRIRPTPAKEMLSALPHMEQASGAQDPKLDPASCLLVTLQELGQLLL